MQTQEQEIQQRILQILLDFNKRGIDQIPVAMIMLLMGVDEDKIPKSEDHNFIQKYLSPIIFGLDEQLITLCAVLSGYLSFPQKKIIIALIIMAFSNSLPDTLSYYENKIGNGQEKELALRESAIVFSSEIISTFIVILPIIFIKDTKTSIILSYVI